MAILPWEIWYQIGNELAEDGSRRDLASLRLVNRVCCHIATPHLYRSLELNIQAAHTVEDDIDQLQVGGLGHPYLRHARQLFLLSKSRPWTRAAAIGRMVQFEWGGSFSQRRLSPTAEGEILGARLTESRIPHIDCFMAFDGSWEPLGSLITRLDCLERLDYSALNPFPAALQEALSRHPSCQLNLWAEQCVGYSEMAGERDPYSICRVLRCSNLHTLTIETAWKRSTVPGWVNLTTQLPFIFVAPNLKNLVLYGYGEHKCRHEEYPRWEIFNRKWRELAAGFEHAPVPALDTLTLAGAHESLLLRLSEAVDLSCLRTLDIQAYCDVEALRDITMAFAGLERLLITVNPVYWPKTNVDNQEAISAVKLFPPLKFLTLRGLRQGSSVLNILQRHGWSLKGLILEPVPDYPRRTESFYAQFTPSEVIQLASLTPHLEELQIQCLRSKGSKAECDFYRGLGHLPNLRQLVLDLDCDVYQQSSGTTTAEIQLMKDGFVNATVDTKLALQVFSLIANNQPSGRLRKLRLAPFRVNISEVDILNRNHFLAKQVLVSRFPLRVEEVAKKEWGVFHDLVEPSRESLPAWLEEALDETLPFVPEREPWWNRYESVPLHVDDT